VEVKIGVQHSPRELIVESAQSQDEVQSLVTDALSDDDGVLTLVDDKGRRVIVPSGRVSYVEIAESETRRVGFGAV
jgi:hypothetical protein